jgi:hypothetical protein
VYNRSAHIKDSRCADDFKCFASTGDNMPDVDATMDCSGHDRSNVLAGRMKIDEACREPRGKEAAEPEIDSAQRSVLLFRCLDAV